MISRYQGAARLRLLSGLIFAGCLCLPVSATPVRKAKTARAAKPVTPAPDKAPVVPPASPEPPQPKPIGNPGDWFPADSYPSAAKIAGQEGRTEFALDIDAVGRIRTCSIVQSSGSELLDTTTCSQLILNGQFEPARDASGRPVASKWVSAMRWKLLEGSGPEE